jgi:AraC family transcriptional regulator, positive regulator of tynA and feaB
MTGVMTGSMIGAIAGLERFSTLGVNLQHRVDYWNQICGKYTPMETTPVDVRTFAPSLTRGAVGSLRFTEASWSPAIVRHSSAHVARTREACFYVHLQLEGSSIHKQDGREAHLNRGDFTILDNTRPYQMTFETTNKVLVMAIPESLMRRQLACPESIVGVRMSYDENLVRVFFDFAQGVWRECGQGIDTVAPALSQALMHLLSSTYARVAEAYEPKSATYEDRRSRLLSYIEEHLCDSELSPATIAAAFRTSPRSLHMIFSRGSETLARYILRRRLEECASILKNPLQQARSISDIAFDNGFSSCTHFGKVFREQFGTTPTEYRRANMSIPVTSKSSNPETH